ncbi:BrnT family toxin [Gluconacetobacter sp. Hr-1-5]|uniref:BrnT family toxin n=1 Tax=Gluconacetobacter sp. Hr-1-5 TaxID=3395370 RepID=UPI003B51E2A0
MFAGELFEKVDDRKDYGEVRIRAAGLIEDVPFMVVYTQRDNVTWIISTRRMHDKEWRRWQE